MNINTYLFILPLLYILLFIIYQTIKVYYPKSEKIIFCSLCAAYFTMLIIAFLFEFPPLLIAFMIGMSMTGISYKLDDILFKKNIEIPLQQFLIHFTLTIISLGIIIFYLNNKTGGIP